MTPEDWLPSLLWAQAAVTLTVGFVLATVLSRLTARMAERAWTSQHVLLLRRVVFWGMIFLFVASALRELGFDLSVLLGAAGVVSVAVGFASQTSASNVISGVFLLAERPFAVGDTIRLGSTTGVVLSIDLLSVKLRTFDNLFVRLPNETVMKSEIVNVTRFPIRRYDLMLRVAPAESLDDVQAVLIAAADSCAMALDEPRPIVIIQGFSESGIEIQLSAWATQASFLELRNTLPLAAETALRNADIAPGYPRRYLIQSEAK